jgi:hypothetical protein
MFPKATSLVVSSCLGLIVACTSEGTSPNTNAGSGGAAGGTGGAAGRTGAGGNAAGGNGGTAGRTGGAGGNGGGAPTGTGGSAGTGSVDAASTGGSSGGGSNGGSGGSNGGPDGAVPTTSCTFSNVMATISPRIGTVGIVTFATDLAGVKSAKIDFGLTNTYGMTAPVDLTAASYRTLLLGMKAAKLYHYRITATGSGGSCTSGDYTIMTGPKPNGVPTVTAMTKGDPTKLAGGFLVTGNFGQGSGGYILDADAEVVWAFSIGTGNVTSARMSYDGRHMWISEDNCCDQDGKSNVHRVSMDGMTDENLSNQFAGQNHQLTILPDETVAFYGYGANGCDDIKERSPNGTTKTIVNAQKAEGVTGGCHLNTIQYSRMDDTYIFSDLDHTNYTKITRTGQTVWVLNGPSSQFGTNLWGGGNHGVDILGPDHILIFNNGAGNAGSLAIEWKLTLTPTKSAMKVWTYASNPPIHVMVAGDVQRLPNGNTIVGYSTRGVLHEVAADGTLLQALSWPLGASFGYIEKRASLYGPPPK